ncbi:MAG: hypothetical protein IIZ40_02920 [Bacilli bacterium]|nr:hypothetical protein [Bacilli bacterium]
MKKIFSLLKACMTSDMNLFKVKSKKKSKQSNNLLVAFLLMLVFMFSIFSNVNNLFQKVAEYHLQSLLLVLFSFMTSLMVIIEGVYKTGPLIFNCRDDQLLLSLPIDRKLVLFVRIFKFYVFELIFNSLFMIPIMGAYILWADNINSTFYLTSIIMLFIMPIIPIIISCIIGLITSFLSSKFKFKNLTQILLSMIFLLGILFFTMNLESIFEYFKNNSNSISDIIKKIYYPSAVYLDLINEFNLFELIKFILVNIFIYVIGILILNKYYFKINSGLKRVVNNKKVNVKDIKIKQNSKNNSLIKKELNIFFKTPVFIVNAGFSLVLFIIMSIMLCIKFDGFMNTLGSMEGFIFLKDLLENNVPLIILLLVIMTSFMTSITSSLISLEGKNITLLKSLPLKTKDILLSKIYACLVLTTPVLFIGDIIMFIRFKIGIIPSIFILLLSVLLPLASHLIGIIINLKYPKLDFENSAEVVKQSMSSFISVMLGMLLLIINYVLVFITIDIFNYNIILFLIIIFYLLLDYILYLILIKKGVKRFNDLTI